MAQLDWALIANISITVGGWAVTIGSGAWAWYQSQNRKETKRTNDYLRAISMQITLVDVKADSINSGIYNMNLPQENKYKAGYKEKWDKEMQRLQYLKENGAA